MDKFELGIFQQDSGEDIRGASMLFRTLSKEYEVGIDNDGMRPRYIYTATFVLNDAGRITKFGKGHILHHENMTVGDIGELVFASENGMNLRHMTAATSDELMTAFIAMMREIVISLVDQEM